VYSRVPPECVDAQWLYRDQFLHVFGTRETQIDFGYLSVRQTYEGFAPTLDPKVSDKPSTAVSNWVWKAADWHTSREYSIDTARYFFRSSKVDLATMPQTRMFQLTYVRSIHLTKGNIQTGPEVSISYPPSLRSNLVVVALPVRALCQVVCSLESGCFVADPHATDAIALVNTLNRELPPLLSALWQDDVDVRRGRAHQRSERPSNFRVATSHIALDTVEPVFAPTLFRTNVYNPASWFGQPEVANDTQQRAREFAMVIAPFRDWSFVILQYPCASIFARDGALTGVRMSLDQVAHIIDRTYLLLCAPGCSTTRIPPMADLAQYKETVGKYRNQPTFGVFGKARNTSGVSRINLPVLPLEAALWVHGP
jgi:hypothetical protein